MSDNRIMSLFVSDIAPDEQSIRNVAFKAILEGAAMTRDGLVTATGFAREKVDTLLDELIKRGLIVIDSDSGRIVGSWGLSLLPTTHKLRIRGRTLHTWCAEDAVGIPTGLGEDASIVSQCHKCGVPVNIQMATGQLVDVEPPDVQLWVTASEVRRSVVGFT